MFLFSADSGARPVPLNSCSDGLLHLRKRGRRGHLEMKKHFCKTEPLFIAFASTHLIGEGFYFTVHGTVLCTNSAVFRCSAKMPAFAWSRGRNAALLQIYGSERRRLDFLRRAPCMFRCSATMPAFAWSRARNAVLVQVCGPERRCSD